MKLARALVLGQRAMRTESDLGVTPPPCDLPVLLTAKDLEVWLKIDVKTIYSYVKRGLIPYVRIQSNVRFVRGQILDWIGEHNFQPHRSAKH